MQTFVLCLHLQTCVAAVLVDLARLRGVEEGRRRRGSALRLRAAAAGGAADEVEDGVAPPQRRLLLDVRAVLLSESDILASVGSVLLYSTTFICPKIVEVW